MSHTPSPWAIKLSQNSINGASIHSGDFRVVTIPRKADRPYPQKEADARLIAAAPDLLEAARDVIAQFERIKQHQHALLNHGLADAIRNWNEATLGLSIDFSKLIAAIAKAEG